MDERIVPTLNKLMPDYVGFIASSGFKRSITLDRALSIRSLLNDKIKTVGVFVNSPISYILKFYNEGAINCVQLHGDEDEDYSASLKRSADIEVIKAVGVQDGKVLPYPKNCDILLLDATDKNARGGTGRCIDWRRYDEVDKRIILAGGITPQNVQSALRKVMPYGVDSSGGLETDGVKDAKKVEEYINNIRSFAL
jgi:phosphoribosylanthranilate isomerase